MNTRVACGVSAAVLLSCGVLAAQDDEFDLEEAPISLVGCIQRETDYRKQNESGKGGFLGFGGGLGDEYVLVNASRGVAGPAGDCTTATGGEAYELTGSAEDDLEPYVGRRVVLSGTRKEAEVDRATGRPTGGRQAGDDLKLFEVDVESFSALAEPVRTDTLARVEPVEDRVQDRRRVVEEDRVILEDRAPIQRQDDTGAVDREQLPRTASPLVTTGLFGLLSLGGFAGLRAMYRRDRQSFR
jgi:hypothetical protein